ncbi:putative glutamine amidotransferase [Desulfuromusa kysingii]|uniref:Putative glutamine amidotransferase n=1 Tax=Desulfuromusa kysingii TaxID=37625 RepID=A0A1H3VU56_9BACT|nr:gamma-glutamyl-gamma-aminobutyrate hydrolase family protein [Desulfuromusa kysingii]SDZ78375.1 putative glutamine amidotransferase [Desulfuromusa kysingii]
MKPMIGITTSTVQKHHRPYNQVTQYYDHSVEISGGLPVLIPILRDNNLAKDLATKLDGLIISGGDEDINPEAYGEIQCQCACQINKERDAWEFSLYRQFKQAGKPILGICRGTQIINVFEGGSLYQNLCNQVKDCTNHYTKNKLMCELYHDIKIIPKSKLYEIFAMDTLTTNSFHNQAVKEIAPGFIASAHSDDGIIEAIESETAPFIIGIQAHPEALTDAHPHFIKLFKAFIKATGKTT